MLGKDIARILLYSVGLGSIAALVYFAGPADRDRRLSSAGERGRPRASSFWCWWLGSGAWPAAIS